MKHPYCLSPRCDCMDSCAVEEAVAELHDELHAIKYEIMGGEDAPGSASAVTLDDVKKEITRLRGIEAAARSLAERYFLIPH